MTGRVRAKVIETGKGCLQYLNRFRAGFLIPGAMTPMAPASSVPPSISVTNEGSTEKTTSYPVQSEPAKDTPSSSERGPVRLKPGTVLSSRNQIIWTVDAVHLSITGSDINPGDDVVVLEELSRLMLQDRVSTSVVFLDRPTSESDPGTIASLVTILGSSAIACFIAKEAYDIFFGPIKDAAKKSIGDTAKRLFRRKWEGAKTELRFGQSVIALNELSEAERELVIATAITYLTRNTNTE